MGRLARAAFPWVLALAAACSAAPNRDGGDAQAPESRTQVGLQPQASEAALGSGEVAAEEQGGVVARVAGQPIYAADLLAHWMHRDSQGLRAHLENLIFSRLVVAEARRLGIVMDASLVEGRFREGWQRLEQEIAREEPGLGVEEYVRTRLGLEPARYRQELRRDLEVDLLAERCVRAWVLQSERAEVRVIVVDERPQLELAQKALADGESFEAVAERYSTHDSRTAGGRIAPVIRSDSGLSRLAFATPLGAVGGPIEEGGHFMLLEVTARPEPLRAAWSEAGPAVEASLAELPIEDPEYWQWKSAMQDDYEVDLRPLRDLLDQSFQRSAP